MGEDGAFKPAFHAFYLYARMPMARKELRMSSADSWVEGFASSNASFVAAAVWTTSTRPASVRLRMTGLPFIGKMQLRVYVIDSTHNNATVGDFIQPTETKILDADAATWQGVLEPHASIFFEASPLQ